MLKQYEFTLDGAYPSHIAYPLYASLLEKAPAAFGHWVHTECVTPVGQYLHENLWRVSLLGPAAIEMMTPVLDDLETLHLLRLDKPVSILKRKVRYVPRPEELLEVRLPQIIRLDLNTPTAFKSNGAYQLLPTQRLIFQSLIQKWNGCFGGICPIEDAGQGLDTLAEGVVFRSVQLDTRQYPMKHTQIPGVIGTMELECRHRGFLRELTCALLTFGTFSGLGVKTTLGMGGMTIQQK